MIFGGRKHQAERDNARVLVRNAAAEGRITTLDRDRRLQELEYAGSPEEIESFVRDLRHPGTAPGQAAAPAWAPSPADRSEDSPHTSQREYDEPAPASAASGAPHGDAGWEPPPIPQPPANAPDWYKNLPVFQEQPHARPAPAAGNRAGCIVGVLVLLAAMSFLPIVGLIGFTSVFTGDSDSGTTLFGEEAGPESVELLTPAGWESMLADLAAQTGSTKVRMATIYDDYALFFVPAGKGRSVVHRYDGELAELTETLGSEQPVALENIELKTVRVLLRKASKGIADVETRYVVVRQNPGEDAPTIVVVVNGSGQSRTLSATTSGAVIHCSGC